MDEMNTNMDLDFRTMTAVLALGGEESLSILGAWNCMKTLAREDPEGCVRLMPGLSMDIAALARKRERCRIRQANRRARNIKNRWTCESSGFVLWFLSGVTDGQHGDIVRLFGPACMGGDVFAQCGQHIRHRHIVSGRYACQVRL